MSSTEIITPSSKDETDIDEKYKERAYSETNTEYIQKIVNVLNAHNTVNNDNALALNRELQQRLLDLHSKLQQLLEETKRRYTANERRMMRCKRFVNNGVSTHGAYLLGGTFYLKGNMFFKDRNCRNCPNNQDYETRSAAGEMFPMDAELRGRHVWSLIDKASIVEAIKAQVIVHLGGSYLQRREPKSRCITITAHKLVNLLACAGASFLIDWDEISGYNLGYRHQPSSCKAMWMMYLHPSLNRGKWTDNENQALLEAAQSHKFQNWDEIAAAVSRRSAFQCFLQYQTEVFYMLPERWGKWTKSDDERLLGMIDRYTTHGVINWNAIAHHFPHKPKYSIIQRYNNYLDPRLSHANFTHEEDIILMSAALEYDAKFSCFPRILFPNRSVTQLRARYRNTLQYRHKHTAWTLEDDEKLMEFINANGTSSWLQCSEMLEYKHSRTSCRTRFLTIFKYFDKHPDALLTDLPRKKMFYKDTAITAENWLQKVAELRENPLVNLNDMERRENKQQPLLSPMQMLSSPPHFPTKETTKKAKTRQQNKQISTLQQNDAIKPKDKSQNNNTLRRNRCKVVYIERLRLIELKLYHCFKYSYNFRLGEEQHIRAPPFAYTIYHVANAFQFILEKSEAYVHGNNLPHLMRQRCKQMLERANGKCVSPAGCHLPPSWASIMAFRTLCVHTTQVNARPAIDNEQHRAVTLFRMRLRTLLYQTTLLSRLQPSSIEGLKNSDLLHQLLIHDINSNVSPIELPSNNVEMAQTTQQINGTSKKRKPRKPLDCRGAAKRKCDKLETLDVKIELES